MSKVLLAVLRCCEITQITVCRGSSVRTLFSVFHRRAPTGPESMCVSRLIAASGLLKVLLAQIVVARARFGHGMMHMQAYTVGRVYYCV